jgi:hypothetical protein
MDPASNATWCSTPRPGNDSDLSLTAGFLSDSSASESVEDVIIISAAAVGAAAASFYHSLARAGNKSRRLSNRPLAKQGPRPRS